MKSSSCRSKVSRKVCKCISSFPSISALTVNFYQDLQELLTKNNLNFPLRIWVIDNSGSMIKTDGHRLVETRKRTDVRVVGCTRWAEIQQTAEYHVRMAALTKAATVFRFLNDPGVAGGKQQFGIATPDTENDAASINEEVARAVSTIHSASPGGVTPLSRHVREIRENIAAMEPELRGDGTRVVVVLATDGLPTDEYGTCDQHTKNTFIDALRSLEGLPVWVVVRLCTDEEEVVDFYNDLDRHLEFSLEVLDDFIGEAEEVNEHNSWLNYALPLHRCREMGYHNRLFDLLDERLLTVDEMKDMMCLLFGEDKFDGVPDPQTDWNSFLKHVNSALMREKRQWNPIKKQLTPWVDVKKLAKTYGKKGVCTIM